MESLPHDTLHHIFSFLPLRQIIICRSLSKHLHQVLTSPHSSTSSPPILLLSTSSPSALPITTTITTTATSPPSTSSTPISTTSSASPSTSSSPSATPTPSPPPPASSTTGPIPPPRLLQVPPPLQPPHLPLPNPTSYASTSASSDLAEVRVSADGCSTGLEDDDSEGLVWLAVDAPSRASEGSGLHDSPCGGHTVVHHSVNAVVSRRADLGSRKVSPTLSLVKERTGRVASSVVRDKGLGI